MKRRKIGVLYSGGLDSAALVGRLIKRGYDVWPVYVRCGLPWEKVELFWAKKYLASLRSPRLKPLLTAHVSLEGAYAHNWSQTGSTPDADSGDAEVFLPARNLLLNIKALLALSGKNVWHLAIATLRGNPFPDATENFFKTFEKILSQSFRRRIRISAPFRKSTKRQILRGGKDLPLHLSFSCINPQGNRHCGHCNKCAERQKGFREAGLADKTRYASGAPKVYNRLTIS